MHGADKWSTPCQRTLAFSSLLGLLLLFIKAKVFTSPFVLRSKLSPFLRFREISGWRRPALRTFSLWHSSNRFNHAKTAYARLNKLRLFPLLFTVHTRNINLLKNITQANILAWFYFWLVDARLCLPTFINLWHDCSSLLLFPLLSLELLLELEFLSLVLNLLLEHSSPRHLSNKLVLLHSQLVISTVVFELGLWSQGRNTNFAQSAASQNLHNDTAE